MSFWAGQVLVEHCSVGVVTSVYQTGGLRVASREESDISDTREKEHAWISEEDVVSDTDTDKYPNQMSVMLGADSCNIKQCTLPKQKGIILQNLKYMYPVYAYCARARHSRIIIATRLLRPFDFLWNFWCKQ